MKKMIAASLFAASLAIVASQEAPAETGGSCYPGGNVVQTYAAMSVPLMREGALVWQVDTDVVVAATTGCLVSVDHLKHEGDLICNASIRCFAYDQDVVETMACDLVIDDGAMAWYDLQGSTHYWSNLPCTVMFYGEDEGR